MKKKKLVFYSDSSHGWLAVKRTDLIKLNILDEISPCSYQRGKTVYLEEDSDLSCFVEAYNKQEGKNFKEDFDIISSYRETSPVRSYASFTVKEHIGLTGIEKGEFIEYGLYLLQVVNKTPRGDLYVKMEEGGQTFRVVKSKFSHCYRIPQIKSFSDIEVFKILNE